MYTALLPNSERLLTLGYRDLGHTTPKPTQLDFSTRRRPSGCPSADGQPDGLRLVEKSNWVGLGVVCPRSRYPKVKSRSEFGNSAVYILTGLEDESELPMVYVGEASPT